MFAPQSKSFYDEFLHVVALLCRASEMASSAKNYEKASEILQQSFKLAKSQTCMILDAFILIRNYQANVWKALEKYDKALAYLIKAENMLKKYR